MKHKRIAIEFPFPVEIPSILMGDLRGFIENVCVEYEKAHPDRRMWLFAEGICDYDTQGEPMVDKPNEVTYMVAEKERR